jgi:hypothetical protein
VKNPVSKFAFKTECNLYRYNAGGCDANDLGFSVRSMFDIEALYAECPRCSFLEAVM